MLWDSRLEKEHRSRRIDSDRKEKCGCVNDPFAQLRWVLRRRNRVQIGQHEETLPL